MFLHIDITDPGCYHCFNMKGNGICKRSPKNPSKCEDVAGDATCINKAGDNESCTYNGAYE